MKFTGWCLFLVGLGFAAFGFLLDPSVAPKTVNISVPGFSESGTQGLADRIANLSLLNLKTNFIVAGAGLFVSGTILIGIASARDRIVEALNSRPSFKPDAPSIGLDREDSWRVGEIDRRMPRL
jgi:hypothetical protein